MDHAFYIYWAYGLTVAIVFIMIAWIFADGRARRQELKALEDAGIRRRSARPEKETA